MKRIITVAVISVLATGCSSIHESAQTRVDQNGTNRITTVKINTLFDAKAVVDKINASNGATHRLGAQGVEADSSSDVVKKMTELLLAVKGVNATSPEAPKVQPAFTQEQLDDAVRRALIRQSNSTAATVTEVKPK